MLRWLQEREGWRQTAWGEKRRAAGDSRCAAGRLDDQRPPAPLPTPRKPHSATATRARTAGVTGSQSRDGAGAPRPPSTAAPSAAPSGRRCTGACARAPSTRALSVRRGAAGARVGVNPDQPTRADAVRRTELAPAERPTELKVVERPGRTVDHGARDARSAARNTPGEGEGDCARLGSEVRGSRARTRRATPRLRAPPRPRWPRSRSPGGKPPLWCASVRLRRRSLLLRGLGRGSAAAAAHGRRRRAACWWPADARGRPSRAAARGEETCEVKDARRATLAHRHTGHRRRVGGHVLCEPGRRVAAGQRRRPPGAAVGARARTHPWFPAPSDRTW